MDSDDECFLQVLNSGSPSEQYKLGRRLELGTDVEKNLARAALLYIRAAEAMNHDAVKVFAFDLFRWKKLNVNSDRFEIIVNAAETGYAQAQYSIGGRFFRGINVDKDYDLAFEWLSKAYAQGHIEAGVLLGIMYREGKGVERNLQKADGLIMDAASQGCAEAQYEVGRAYETGSVGKKDPRTASEWYKKAAYQDHPNAMYRLAEMYRDGIGVEHSSEKAIKWFMIARKACRMAWFKIGQMYETGYDDLDRDMSKAVECYEISARAGYHAAYYYLAQMYEEGIYFERDMDKAIELYRRAASAGLPLAKYRLMMLHIEGVWLGRDDNRIRRYWDQIKNVQGMEKPEGFPEDLPSGDE